MPHSNPRLKEVIDRVTDPISGLLGSEPMYVRELARRAADMREYYNPQIGRYYSCSKQNTGDTLIRRTPIGWTECVAALKTLNNATRTLRHTPQELVNILSGIYGGRQFIRGSIVPVAVFIQYNQASFPETGGIDYVPNHIYLLTGRFEDDVRYRRALHRKIAEIGRASSAGFRNARNWEIMAEDVVSRKAFPHTPSVLSHFNSPEPDILIDHKMLAVEITTRSTNPLDEDYLATKLANIPQFYDMFLITTTRLTETAERFIPRINLRGYLVEGAIHVRYFPSKKVVESQRQDVGVISGSIAGGQLHGTAVITPSSGRDARAIRKLHRSVRQYTRAEMEEWLYRSIRDMFYRLSTNIYVIYRRLYYLMEYSKPRKVLYYQAEAFLQHTLEMTPDRIERQMQRLRNKGWITYKDKRYSIEFMRSL